jgi:nucleotide-binding universal stress UspA family protein
MLRTEEAPMDVIVVLLGWAAIVVVSMLLVAYLATRWGRDAFGWLLLAAVTGPIAIIALFGTHQRDIERPEAFERRGAPLSREAQKVILVGCDGSEQSERAARYASEEFADADEVVLVTIMPREARPPGDDPRALQEHEQRVDASTAPSMDALRAAGLSTRLLVGYGAPAEEILRAAAEELADVVVIGKRGAGLARGLLGSVSDHVLKHAKVPVVVVD